MNLFVFQLSFVASHIVSNKDDNDNHINGQIKQDDQENDSKKPSKEDTNVTYKAAESHYR